MSDRFFPFLTKPVPYEGPDSDNPMAFKWYDAKRKIAGKTMEQHLRFAVCYWHTFKGTGADPFGGPAHERPWNAASDPLQRARDTMDAAFEFFRKLGVPFWCFHDRDIAPEGATVSESNANLEALVQHAKKLQKETGVRLLWGTANLFSHPRYAHGAATSPDPLVFAHACAQVRRALDATVELGGTGYVFWGGREGYSMLYNTDMKQEADQFARFLFMAHEYAQKIGFKGRFFIEPKPKEPSTHQYDYDAATVLGFLSRYNIDFVDLNIENNHATLAGHSFAHELMVASQAGRLGSLDINRGNPLLGWDTDQFPTVLEDAVWAMHIILDQGGLKYGGLNFDAKVRRGSFDLEDLFYAHIGAMDTFARALIIADRMRKDGLRAKWLAERYAGWKKDFGSKVLKGQVTLEEAELYAIKEGEPKRRSGREELFENIVNQYLYDRGLR
ncbi:MAG: xylose isomerase [Planctomycetota bacterium]|nr:xylose isomerase [Planctomycetota bacterium]MCX8040351.1 xylose isomerase [Planctomycetota bacterium]MDW8373807.1 xylose isomerase [Planctomycetota bacterium]